MVVDVVCVLKGQVIDMRLKPQMLFVVISVALIFLAGCEGGDNTEDGTQEQITYSIRTNFDEYSNDELDELLFDEIISSFSPEFWDFMVLSPDIPIQDSTFIQVGAPQESVGFVYTIEIGFETKEDGLTLYRLYTDDHDIALQCIIDYWQDQKIPDVATWEDVTWEMKQ